MHGSEFLLFMAASLVINLSPGPSLAYVSTVAAAQGCRAGAIASLGLAAGIFCHVLAAASGVAVLLATSQTAFMLLKYLGAAYLVCLGLRTLLRERAQPPGSTGGPRPRRLRGVFLQGILVDLLNP
ncbi:MAG: LysE family translocator, partial [Gammaproteobacteria bacterium]|nr:LysE family translocator [Gammaproteobacteria bacterium]